MGILFNKDNQFYHASIRRYVVLFGSLFSDLHIKRVADNGREELIQVPIRYGNQNTYLGVDQGPGRETTKISRILPAMAFEIKNFYKDVSRKTNPMNVLKSPSLQTSTSGNFQYNRVPYNFIFSLYLRAKNMDDMNQMVEQIIPAFDGNLAVTIEDIAATEIEVNQDIVIRLDEIDISDDYDDEMKSRLIDYTITFELKGYLYKRTQTSYNVKEVDIQNAMVFDGGYVSIDTSDVYTSKTPIQGEIDNFNSMNPLVNTNLVQVAKDTEPKVRRTRKAKA